ncbi:hypothetical protein AVEN_237964-1 [Araneus ventricosus]|uniref:Uncharacterized protein n=1 Tax=Araneus ventricosus TaxID=182803 RepID=A0A4Y2P0Z1_ARAVE|nr:hypothetical protein AVEN_237964-1 [Araneus ventricosus]
MFAPFQEADNTEESSNVQVKFLYGNIRQSRAEREGRRFFLIIEFSAIRYCHEPVMSFPGNVNIMVGKRHLQRFLLGIGVDQTMTPDIGYKTKVPKMLEVSSYLY